MPVTAAQLAAGANNTLMQYAKNDPIDQFTKMRPFAEWLIANSQPSLFGNGIFNEKVLISNQSNYQNYTGDQQVTYNKRDAVRLSPWQHYEFHDGFSLNETELANNGIIMTDDRNNVVPGAEAEQIVNILDTNYGILKEGAQENWDLEMHRDGSASTISCPGLDLIVSTTPTTGVVGGIDSATSTYWRSNVNTGISTATPGTLTSAMEVLWRQCMTYGKLKPDFIVCGSKFLDAYRVENPSSIVRQIQVNTSKNGMNLENGTDTMNFHGVPLVWDPTFDTLQASDAPSIAWDKRCYFLQSKSLKLRPFKGRWMINRKPPRIYDRYTYYFGLTSDYGLTANKRNSMAVLSIA